MLYFMWLRSFSGKSLFYVAEILAAAGSKDKISMRTAAGREDSEKIAHNFI
jgi:hypothetical protein